MPATRSTTLLPGLLDRLADYRRLRQAVTQGKSPLALSGLAAVHRTHFAAALRQDTKRPLVLACTPTTPRPVGPPGTWVPFWAKRSPSSRRGTFSSTPAPPAASGSSSAWPS